MRQSIPLAAVLLTLSLPAYAADPIAEARRLYNLGQYDAAERLAREASVAAGLADSARAVLGRIRLERYRQTANASDLAAARESLRAVDPNRLDARERAELTVGLGEALFFEDRFGAAAEMFGSVLDGADGLAPASRERLLDWWATALHKQAQMDVPEDRPAYYDRIIQRMRAEIAENRGSTPACYWLVAAARASGDLDAAWQAAQAGWVSAPFGLDRGAALRADLDRLVVQAIIPERAARLPVRESKQVLNGMLHEWEAFKSSWSK